MTPTDITEQIEKAFREGCKEGYIIGKDDFLLSFH